MQLLETVKEKIQRKFELELIVASVADNGGGVVRRGRRDRQDIRIPLGHLREHGALRFSTHLRLGFRARGGGSVEQFLGEAPHPATESVHGVMS